MEVSGQLHIVAALTPEKEPPVPIGQEAGWSQSWSGCNGKEKISSVLLLWIKPHLSSPYPSHYTDWATPVTLQVTSQVLSHINDTAAASILKIPANWLVWDLVTQRPGSINDPMFCEMQCCYITTSWRFLNISHSIYWTWSVKLLHLCRKNVSRHTAIRLLDPV